MKAPRVALSGYFDPLHCGHIRMMKEASDLFQVKVCVILNNSAQCILKKGFEFMPANERAEILKSISYVATVVHSIDTDATVRQTLIMLKPDVFIKGGYEYNESNLPEMDVCRDLGIDVFFGVGGSKIQSSSSLIEGTQDYKKQAGISCLCGNILTVDILGNNNADGKTFCEICKRHITIHFRR